ncbi:MAG: amidohydrolase family protein, partial [Phycisphaerae bacterium]|nr:amidohydrolase family protein [Phycisphaerae bacterium]
MLIQGFLLADPAKKPEPGYLRIDNGRIAEIRLGDLPRNSGPPDLGSPSHIICPAFIDAHFHFPQIDSIGCDGMPLLEWLDKVIFPAEAWWGKGAAVPATRTAIRRLTNEGTVGVAGYLTSHAQGSAEAVALLARTPMRFHVGRVAMDRNAPDDLTDEDRRRAAMRPIPSPILAPNPSLIAPRQAISANPRFAISCTPELLAEIGWTINQRQSQSIRHYLQTHLAESPEECAQVRHMFHEEHYTSVYDKFNLLNERTILAHCIHLADPEWELIARRKSIVASCPGANMFLRAGLFNLDKARDFAVRLTLGSDVAAGPDIAMPRVARQFIETAKVRALTSGARHVPAPAEAWNLITRHNADALGWHDAGRLETNAAADLLVLRVPDLWHDEHL